MNVHKEQHFATMEERVSIQMGDITAIAPMSILELIAELVSMVKCLLHNYLIALWMHTFSDVGPCFFSPCMNGGTCNSIEGSDTYSCTCPDNLSGLNCNEVSLGNFTYLVIDRTKTWADSQHDCLSRGYNLTSILDEEEMALLSDLVR